MQSVDILNLLEILGLYFLSSHFIYAALMFFSWRQIRQNKISQTKEPLKAKNLPGVSFLVPLHNEQELIVETVQTYISLDIHKQIILVDDGSVDSTFPMLQNFYQLSSYHDTILGKIYRSLTHPEMIVIRLPHQGKAAALNHALKAATYPIVCTMDADTVPSANGVRQCLEHFKKYPHTIAAGGVLQVLNGQKIQNNQVERFHLPSSPLSMFQMVEYIRAFVCERLGWSFLNSNLIISGAFCMVRKEQLIKANGFTTDSITEDFDLIMRLRKNNPNIKDGFPLLPITTCWTQVPEKMSHLLKQRERWHAGLIRTLYRHRSLLFNPKYQKVGLFSVPYFWLFELISPLVEVIAILLVPFALIMGWIDLTLLTEIFAASICFQLFLTYAGLLINHKEFLRMNKIQSGLTIMWYAFLIHFGYKQIISFWRCKTLFSIWFKKDKWGSVKRSEITHSPL